MKKIAKNRTFEFILIIEIKILKIPAQVHKDLERCSQRKKKNRALRVIGSPEWREHMHAQKLAFINIDYRKK